MRVTKLIEMKHIYYIRRSPESGSPESGSLELWVRSRMPNNMLLEHFYGKYEPESFVELFCFDVSLHLIDFIMGETEIPTFHDLWSRGPVGPLIYGREYTKLFGMRTSGNRELEIMQNLCAQLF